MVSPTPYRTYVICIYFDFVPYAVFLTPQILRQVLNSARRGDSVEVGLFVEPVNGEADEDLNVTPDIDTPWQCILYIAHRYTAADPEEGLLERIRPTLSGSILQRLLQYVSATLEMECQSRTPLYAGYACEFKLVLDPGDPLTTSSTVPTTPESFVGYPEFQIAQEPTLEQLAQFTEGLRGKKATLHASSRGPFAHHLSSYLTAWGMDVSHVSTEPDGEGAEQAESSDGMTPVPGIAEQSPSLSPTGAARTNVDPLSFVLIDDDVQALRTCLLKAKAEQAYPLTLNARKRPSLATNHRPKSSPQVARVIGPTSTHNPTAQIVIVHFTSLSKFKLVKDAIQSILTPYNGSTGRIPELIVIPKPAGPRRFLTALHTAVTKPVVDPFFIPIATSPTSPGLHAFSPFFTMGNAPGSPSGRSSGTRTASDRSNRSPKEHPADGSTLASSPLGSDRMEYFSDATGRLGSSPSTGLVISSPDGQPAGIFFHPKGKGWSTSPQGDRDGKQDGRLRGSSFLVPPPPDDASSTRSTVSRSRTRSQLPPPDEETKMKASKGKTIQPSPSASDDLPSMSSDQSVSASEMSTQPGPSRFTSRRSSQASSPPTSPQARHSGPTASMRRTSRRQGNDAASPSGQPKKLKGPGEANIVPPISVLIVDGTCFAKHVEK